MKLGIVGIGKLGFPLALAFDAVGHQVFVTDTSPEIKRHFEARTWPHVERHVPEMLESHRIKWGLPAGLDVAFVTVQTPHLPRYDGTHPLDETRADFDYTYLAEALTVEAETVAVVSTVLPGTWRRLFTDVDNYVYNPSFIAMGTVIDDLRRAEFNLIGSDSADTRKLVEVWRTVNDAPNLETGITEAEAVKVAYNSYISMKVALANTWGWLGHQVGFNSGVVMEALALADRRLISRAYMQPGMGDGGACHPRDLIALSWLAREHRIYDLFGGLAEQREVHTEWLASFLPDGVVIFGQAFKPDVQIDTGSASLLLAYFLERQGTRFILGDDPEPGRFNFIATAHTRYREIQWPQGSVVLDPHGIIKDQAGVKVIRLGR